MRGRDLQELLIDKWGYSFDIQFRRTQGKIFLQVMWRYLERFPSVKMSIWPTSIRSCST